MKKIITKVAAAAMVGFSAAATPAMAAAAKGKIAIDGSSTVYPITEAVAEEFQAQNPDVRVTVGISGTGGGLKRFGRGETDISGASRPIKAPEVEAAKKNKIGFIELPVAFDGLAVVVNPENSWAESMTVKELQKLWEPAAEGKVTRWNQIRPNWPNEEIHLFGAGTDSGTYDYFTEAIVGVEHSSRGDFTASEDDNVLVQGVSSDKNALGFFGLAYYEHNKDRLKLIAVDDGNPSNGAGPVLPTTKTVANGTYQPLARPIFIYVSTQSADRPELQEFVKFYIENAGQLASEVGYIPLPGDVYDLAMRRFENRTTGSIFGGKGSKVGVSLAGLLSSEQGR